MTAIRRCIAALGLLLLAACASGPKPEIRPQDWPAVTPGIARDAGIEARVEALLGAMPLEQKVGQVIQGDINSLSPEDAAAAKLGSVLAGGNSGPRGFQQPSAAPWATGPEWLDYADRIWEANRAAAGPGPFIPILFGIDAVHGHNNVIGATLFPHNIGLGAAHDPDLVRRIAEITARELAVTGLDWTFAPTLAVAHDDRWGRTYESYSEDPALVAQYAEPVVKGLQGPPTAPFGPDRVIATAKHFLGDGGVAGGKDQGETKGDEIELRRVHGAGYPPALEAGAQTLMASFSSWRGRKMHGFEPLLTGVVKQRWGFDGFIVGDWNAHAQLPGCRATDCPQALLAGVDMYMAPDSWRGLADSLLAQVRSGEVPLARLDDAVRRILRVKLRAGLFEQPKPSERPLAGRWDLLGAPEHRAVAREAVRKSLVLLKNDGVLPLAPQATLLVTGAGADSIARQSGGWTLNWQGDAGGAELFPGATTILAGLRAAVEPAGGRVVYSPDGGFAERPDAAVVVFGEAPYAEWHGDLRSVDFRDPAPLATLRRLQAAGVPTVAVFLSGRPLHVTPELEASNAFVAAWLPGSEGGGVADVLVARADGTPAYDFTGRLSFSWPARPQDAELNYGDADYDPLFPLGFGLSYAQTRPAAKARASQDAVSRSAQAFTLAHP